MKRKMRRVLLICAGLFHLGASAQGQNFIRNVQLKKVGSKDVVAATYKSVVQKGDNIFIGGSSVYRASSRDYLVDDAIVKLDASGNHLKSKVSSQGNGCIYDMVSDNSQNLFVCGGNANRSIVSTPSTNGSPNNGVFFVASYDGLNLTRNWNVIIDDGQGVENSTNSCASAVIESKNANGVLDGIVAIGYSGQRHLGAVQSPFLIVTKRNANTGAKIWTQYYKGKSTKGVDIVQTADGHYVILGSDNGKWVVSKIDQANGSILWQKFYNNEGEEFVPISLILDYNGDLLVLGKHNIVPRFKVKVEASLYSVDQSNGAIISKLNITGSSSSDIADLSFLVPHEIVKVGNNEYRMNATLTDDSRSIQNRSVVLGIGRSSSGLNVSFCRGYTKAETDYTSDIFYDKNTETLLIVNDGNNSFPAEGLSNQSLLSVVKTNRDVNVNLAGNLGGNRFCGFAEYPTNKRDVVFNEDTQKLSKVIIQHEEFNNFSNKTPTVETENLCEDCTEGAILKEAKTHNLYCIDLTLECEVFKFSNISGTFIPVDSKITEPGVYEERCYSETGCLLSVTTHNVNRLLPTTTTLNLYACDDNCNGYMADDGFGIVDIDGYTLTGISGPNSEQYNYNSDIGYTNSDGVTTTGWIGHCLLRGGVYRVDYYNRDANGYLTCLTSSVIINVLGASIDCPEDQEYIICAGSCQTIGYESVQKGTYAWSDGYSNSNGIRSVCPTETTTYELEFTNEAGCKCVTRYVVSIKDGPELPALIDDEICVGEEYCTEFQGTFSDLLNSTVNQITYDFGDGSVTRYKINKDTYPKIRKCHFYSAAGNYTVRITYETSCGVFVVESQVVVRETEIRECRLVLSEHEFRALGQSVDLDLVLGSVDYETCCPEVIQHGTWFDMNGATIQDPSSVDRQEFSNGVYKELLVDADNCILCRLVLTVEGQERIAKKQNDYNGLSGRGLKYDSQATLSSIGKLSMVYNNFKLAPNPSAGNFKIVNSTNLKVYDGVKIMSIDGKVISEASDVKASKFYDLKGNRDGIYFIEISTGDTIERLRLVLQN